MLCVRRPPLLPSAAAVRAGAVVALLGLLGPLAAPGLGLAPGRARADTADPDGGRYRTRVSAERPAPASVDRFTLQGEALRTVPGSLGDPFRVLAALPGVASPIPGLPVLAIRGASPGTSGFFLDGMRLPQLFHLLVGGGVVHASLVDRLDFFPSGYDVTFGRFAGGIVAASTRPARSDGQHFEAALRVYDASALVELSLPRGVRISVSGHYGYPGPILQAIDDRIRISYWDYQFRL